MEKEKILVTGGAGYIGSHTCVELIGKGHEVVIVDNLVNSDKDVIDRIKKITGVLPKFYLGDVCDTAFLDKVFVKEKFTSVIHFAGLKAVGESVKVPLKYYKNNLIATISLLECMNKYNVKKLVFSSSSCVYGNPDKLPFTENFPLMPATNPYGATKAIIEGILTDVAKADSAFCAILLRYFNPVGAHPSCLIGEDPKGIPNNLSPYIAQVAIGKLPELSVYGNDYKTVDGTGVRDYIHVVDLAFGHIAALEKIKNPGVHIYNLGTGQGTSVLQFVKAFEKASGKKIPYTIKPRREGDIDSSYASCAKAKKELGWSAKYNIDDMCKSLWNFYNKKG